MAIYARWDRFLAILMCASFLAVYLLYFTPQKRAVRSRLSEADTKSEAAIDARLQPLVQLFAKGRRGSKQFAKEALSWNGKWALVQGFVDKDAHRKYLAESFARNVFTKEELHAAIESTCLSYADDLTGVENEMLVLLHADLADPDRPAASLSPHLRSNEAFAKEYRRLADRVIVESKSDLAVTVGREVAVLVGTEIASRAAMQAARTAAAEMGIQGGLLGAGAASGSVATLGVGLIVAVIIDYSRLMRCSKWRAMTPKPRSPAS